jgi:hypothetical protein
VTLSPWLVQVLELCIAASCVGVTAAILAMCVAMIGFWMQQSFGAEDAE